MARSRVDPGRECVTARSEIDKRFSGLPALVRDWLAGQPGIVRVLSQIEQRLSDGSLSPEDLSYLAKRWSEKLPPRRGIVVRLRDIAQQPELPIELPQSRRMRRRRRKKGRMK